MIGQGVYTLSEVARFTKLHPTTVRSWFKGRSDGKGRGRLFGSDYDPVEGDYAVSFLNLIEVYVGAFFHEEGVKTQVIRRVHDVLQGRMKTRYPFAHARLSTDGHRIFHESDLSEVISMQMFLPIIESKLTRISYDVSTRLADTLHIANGVVLNPGIGFGKPVIKDAGVSTLIVAKQYRANGGNARLVAKLFNITEEGVMDAYRFKHGETRRVA